MRRTLIGGMALLLYVAVGVAMIARSKPAMAANSATADKLGRLAFVFLRVDATQDLAILHPIIAPDIGVQLDAGPRKLDRGTLLNCRASARTHSALVESQIGQVSELLLDCGEYKFVVKTIDFDPHAK